jgi:transposase, IS5 family
MKQQTLAMAADDNTQYEQYRRPTRRDTFLATMEQIVPWSALCEVIEPHYPKAGNGRPPVGLERMLRMYFVQHWFNLADAACEDALLDSTALRRFVGIDLGRERVPDATTLLKFRRLLEKHKLGEALFAKVVKRLWGFDKVRYRGLAKNATRSFVALGLANIYLARGVLYGEVRP